jgi:hypothetical protein
MRIRLPLDDAEYFVEFALVKLREVWPHAVVLDSDAECRYCNHPRQLQSGYGIDIFRSESEVADLFSGECDPLPPSVNISWSKGVASISGANEAVRHLALQPLWSSK